MNSTSMTRYAVVLGLITAVGPAGIDMYLSSLPSIGHALNASPQMAQATLMAFYLALGAGQLIAGPLSDMFGRKPPMTIGLGAFLVASIGCALAPNIETLVAFRLLQGLGACAAMVTPRAVVRDLYTGPTAARLMSLLLTVYSVSPILAPLAGSAINDLAGWRGVFWALAGVAVLALAMIVTWLPETRPVEDRTQSTAAGALSGYRTLLSDSHFVSLALIASCSLATFFVYVANSSFVFTGHYGVSPRVYALLFALNAVTLVLVSQFNGWVTARLGLRRTVRLAVVCQAVTIALLLALTWAGVDRLEVLVVALLVVYGLNGVIVPSTFVLAMERHAMRAGSASASIGMVNFAGGALAMALVAPFADGTPLPVIAGIAACSTVALGLALRALR
jgi:DHA1 family bicyclomycin/chloramphenicol resistance-like MFS transporter